MNRPLTAALLALAAASPAAAQDWNGVARLAGDINSTDPALAYLGAVAACLAGRGDPEWNALIFASAGWARGSDAPGLETFRSSHPGLHAEVAADGSFCAAHSEGLGTDTATAHVFRIMVAGMLAVDSAKGPHGCKAYALAPGVMAEVTSSGADPTCESSRSSAVRISFAPSP